MTILDKIAANRRAEIERLKQDRPLDSFFESLETMPPAGFKTALQDNGRINIIAEVKKKSPSRGVLRADFDPEALAAVYERGGAAAISVLTEERHFSGRFEYLAQIRKRSDLPLLCKDFVVDRYQIFHAKSLGADAVLLIVALHTPRALARHLRLATQVGIDALVEVHNGEELKVALDSGAEIVGVNNRNLKDFTVSLETAERLAVGMPPHILKVAESGIHTYFDIARLRESGFSSFLIGEALVTSPDPITLLQSLRGA